MVSEDGRTGMPALLMSVGICKPFASDAYTVMVHIVMVHVVMTTYKVVAYIVMALLMGVGMRRSFASDTWCGRARARVCMRACVPGRAQHIRWSTCTI